MGGGKEIRGRGLTKRLSETEALCHCLEHLMSKNLTMTARNNLRESVCVCVHMRVWVFACWHSKVLILHSCKDGEEYLTRYCKCLTDKNSLSKNSSSLCIVPAHHELPKNVNHKHVVQYGVDSGIKKVTRTCAKKFNRYLLALVQAEKSNEVSWSTKHFRSFAEKNEVASLS